MVGRLPGQAGLPAGEAWLPHPTAHAAAFGLWKVESLPTFCSHGWLGSLLVPQKRSRGPEVGKGLQQLWALTTPLLCPGCDILVSKPWQCQEGFLKEREGAMAHHEPVWGGLGWWEPVPPEWPRQGAMSAEGHLRAWEH